RTDVKAGHEQRVIARILVEPAGKGVDHDVVNAVRGQREIDDPTVGRFESVVVDSYLIAGTVEDAEHGVDRIANLRLGVGGDDLKVHHVAGLAHERINVVFADSRRSQSNVPGDGKRANLERSAGVVALQ